MTFWTPTMTRRPALPGTYLAHLATGQVVLATMTQSGFTDLPTDVPMTHWAPLPTLHTGHVLDPEPHHPTGARVQVTRTGYLRGQVGTVVAQVRHGAVEVQFPDLDDPVHLHGSDLRAHPGDAPAALPNYAAQVGTVFTDLPDDTRAVKALTPYGTVTLRLDDHGCVQVLADFRILTEAHSPYSLTLLTRDGL